jgi:hypothetical protein
MSRWLTFGIAVTTLAWVAVGIWLTVKFAPQAEVGALGVAFGWMCAYGVQAGLLVSPFASRATTRIRVVMFAMLIPGLAILIACTVDALDGHKSYFEPMSLLTYASLLIWCAAGYHVVRPNTPQQPTALRAAAERHSR